MWITDDVDDMQFERNISYGVLACRQHAYALGPALALALSLAQEGKTVTVVSI